MNERLFYRGALAETAFKEFQVSIPAPLAKVSEPIVIVVQFLTDREIAFIPVKRLTLESFVRLGEGTYDDRPLERLVNWRVESRFGEPIFCSSFAATKSELSRFYETDGLDAVAKVGEGYPLTIEAYLSEKWMRIYQWVNECQQSSEQRNEPRIVVLEHHDGKITACPCVPISPIDYEVIEDGVDGNSPLGPTQWRMEKRDSEIIYCSQFTIGRDEAIKLLESSSNLPPGPSVEIVLENYASDSWRQHRTPVGEPRELGEFSRAERIAAARQASRRNNPYH